jgi:pimeloyl-ACP methyl ester carboxylesterase
MKRIIISLLIAFVVLAGGAKIHGALSENEFESKSKRMMENASTENLPGGHEEEKTVVVNGNTIHYYVSGVPGRPVVLFIHPAFGDHACFYRQVEFFAREFRVITVDLVGHGASKARYAGEKVERSHEHVREILRREDVKGVHVVGVSLGALIAQYFALSYPGEVLSLTSLGGYNINEEHEDVAKTQRKEAWGWMARAVFSMRSFRRHVASAAALREEEQVKFYACSEGFSRRSFVAMSGMDRMVEKRSVPPREYPLLILAGEEDNELAKRKAREWHVSEPGSECVFIERAGHCAQMDNPDRFNEVVYRVIQRGEEGARGEPGDVEVAGVTRDVPS